jgi:hypothetical protein
VVAGWFDMHRASTTLSPSIPLSDVSSDRGFLKVRSCTRSDGLSDVDPRPIAEEKSHHELCFIHLTKQSVVISLSLQNGRHFRYPCVAVESGFGRIL